MFNELNNPWIRSTASRVSWLWLAIDMQPVGFGNISEGLFIETSILSLKIYKAYQIGFKMIYFTKEVITLNLNDVAWPPSFWDSRRRRVGMEWPMMKDSKNYGAFLEYVVGAVRFSFQQKARYNFMDKWIIISAFVECNNGVGKVRCQFSHLVSLDKSIQIGVAAKTRRCNTTGILYMFLRGRLSIGKIGTSTLLLYWARFFSSQHAVKWMQSVFFVISNLENK